MNKELIDKLTPEAAERLALLQLLFSTCSPLQAEEIINQRAGKITHQVLADGRLVEVDLDESELGKEGRTTLSKAEQKGLCAQLLAALAGVKYPTPEETYGCNLIWAVGDAINALHKKSKEWRVPKTGDKVKLLAFIPGTENTSFIVGEIYEVESITVYTKPCPLVGYPYWWKENTFYAVMLKNPTDPISSMSAYLENVEAI